MIVVDASVAVKWYLKENYSDDAIALLTLGEKIVGPLLASYEVAGAFARAFRNNTIDRAFASECLEGWLHAIKTNVIRFEFHHADIARGSELAAQLHHPLADCVYLAMAERLNAPLITADIAFYDKSKADFKQLCFVSDGRKLETAL